MEENTIIEIKKIEIENDEVRFNVAYKDATVNDYLHGMAAAVLALADTTGSNALSVISALKDACLEMQDFQVEK